MKKWIFLILMCLANPAWCCNCETCNNKALRAMDTAYTQAKSYRLNNAYHPHRKRLCYTIVMSVGVSYQWSVYMRYTEGKKEFYPLLICRKYINDGVFTDSDEDVTPEWIWNKETGYGKLNYTAPHTGIYEIQFYLAELSCGAAVLGINKKTEKTR